MIYLVTYAVFNEPHTVECELKDDGKFWFDDTVVIDEEIILHKEKKKETNNSDKTINLKP